MNTINLEAQYQLPTYSKLPLVLVKGKGTYVWDETGKKYLDFYGGHSVSLLGHCYKPIVQAICKQADKLIFYSNIVYNDTRARAAQKLVELAAKDFSKVFFCNSGTEANETALKLAKKFTGKDEIVSFIGSFHGRTAGSLSVTGFDKYKKHVGSLLPNVKFATFGDLESVKNVASIKTAAIILEPIQSIAGVNEATPEFYIGLRKFCTENNIVLIFDEVQTGLGRTGKLFYGDHFDIFPDIVTLAKGLGGGLPAGAVLINSNIADTVEIDDQGSTFGGGPVVCAAILATVKAIKNKNFVHKVFLKGQILKEKISTLPHVLEVKGRGMLLGIMIDLPAKSIQNALIEQGVITGTSSDPNVLRIMPPLNVSKPELEKFTKMLHLVLKEFV
ncbi:aspartate aminotransferase family protein [Candidatus Gottesmanbacteria bacterium]|nr:aspartate aminotransferase family protein [Candidatus Gottesmanbacteria bacterium]